MDKKVRDKSKKDAPARLFLMLIELFSEFEREPMTYEEFEESMEGDCFTNHLLLTLEDKACYYEESMRVLHDMLGNWQTFWHFDWLKDQLDMITTVGALQLSLRAKLKSAFQKLL